MSRRYSGFLVSQLLDILGTPLAEERVWGLCFEMCKSLVDTSNEDIATADEDGSLRSATRVVFEVDTVYVRKEGSVAFVLDGNCTSLVDIKEHVDSCSYSQHMKGFGKLLSTFLGRNTAVFECFEKRPVAGEDLENLMHYMIQGRLKDTQEHWVHLVSDCCVRHALSTSRSTELPSEYYRRVCKDLADEALEVNKFLEVLKSELSLLRSHDALCALQWLKARSSIRRWLRVMSELRESFTRGHIDAADRPSLQVIKPPLSAMPRKSISTLSRGQSETPSPPSEKRATQFPSKSGSEQPSPDGEPRFSSTPLATCKSSRKVLRPPQRLVDQVTNWMLEAEDWVPNNPRTGIRASTTSVEKSENLHPAEWTEFDSHGSERDVSSSSGRQQSTSGNSSPSEDWFREITRIRGVLTELELDTFMEKESLFDVLQSGKICFCCRHTKFSLFSRWGVVCDVCQKKVCSSCVVQARPRDLGMSSCDAAKGRHGDDVLTNIRRIFKPKTGGRGNGNDMKVCKDCRDFVQRFY